MTKQIDTFSDFFDDKSTVGINRELETHPISVEQHADRIKDLPMDLYQTNVACFLLLGTHETEQVLP